LSKIEQSAAALLTI